MVLILGTRIPSDLLRIITGYAAPDDDELIIKWLCKENRDYKDISSGHIIRIIVKKHHLDKCRCDMLDLTDDAPGVCMWFGCNNDTLLVRGFGVGGMINILQKSERPLRHSNDKFRFLTNEMREDVKNFCSAERDRWCRSIIDLLE